MAEQNSQAPKIRTSMQMSRVSIEALHAEQASTKPESSQMQFPMREFIEKKQAKKTLTIPEFSCVYSHSEGQSPGGKSPGEKGPGGKSPVARSPVLKNPGAKSPALQGAGAKIVSFAPVLSAQCKPTSPRSAYSTKPLAFSDAVDSWTGAELLHSKHSRKMSSQASHATLIEDRKPLVPLQKETIRLPKDIIPVVLKAVDSFELDDSEDSSEGEKFHSKQVKGKRLSVPDLQVSLPKARHDALTRYMENTTLGSTASKRRSSDTPSTYV